MGPILDPTCINARTCEEIVYMAPHNTINVNGRAYDSVTGLPIDSTAVTTPDRTPSIPKPKPQAVPTPKPTPTTSRGVKDSAGVHSTAQRSQTLVRRATKKPAAPQKPVLRRPTPGRHMDIAKSTDVTRFAKHPVMAAPAQSTPKAQPAPKKVSAPAQPKKTPATKTTAAAVADKPARLHPIAQRALTRHSAKKTAARTAPATAKEVKEAAIAKALATPTTKAKKPARTRSPRSRRLIIIGSVILVIIAALYAAWRLIPNISVSMAAAQAGIHASYPEYTPDGYSLSQPVTYSDGEVGLKFVSHSNDNHYSITQTRSSWDSTAVLDNVVTPAAGANYVTTRERGLTIYTYDTAAAWVNGGILYKIDSKAPLSSDQIRRIATSL